jgi:hypothetical protein
VNAVSKVSHIWDITTEELESIADLYQNHCNTCQTDGEKILYILKRKKLNQGYEQKFVY